MPVKVSVKFAPRKIHIGDTVRYSVSISADKDVYLKYADIEKSLKGFALKDSVGSDDTTMGKRLIRKEFLITQYSPGEYRLPDLKVEFRKKGKHAWRSIDVKGGYIRVEQTVDIDPRAEQLISMETGPAGFGTIGGTESMGRLVDKPIRFKINDFIDPKNIKTRMDWIMIAVYVLAGIILFIFFVLFLISFIKNMRRKNPPKPHEVAIRRLGKLRSQKLIEKGQVKEFCSELSSILMTYTQERFNLPEVKRTFGQFINALGGVEELTDDQKVFLASRLDICDKTKYSGYSPKDGELDGDLKEEIELVGATIPLSDEEEGKQ